MVSAGKVVESFLNLISNIRHWIILRMRKKAMLRQLLTEVKHNIAVLEAGLTHFGRTFSKEDENSTEARVFLWRLPALLSTEGLKTVLGVGELSVLVQKDIILSHQDNDGELVKTRGELACARLYLKISEVQTLARLSITDDPEHIKIRVRLNNILGWLHELRLAIQNQLK